MQSTRLFGLALASVALLAAVTSAAARPGAAQWRILLTSDREGDSEIYSVAPTGAARRG